VRERQEVQEVLHGPGQVTDSAWGAHFNTAFPIIPKTQFQKRVLDKNRVHGCLSSKCPRIALNGPQVVSAQDDPVSCQANRKHVGEALVPVRYWFKQAEEALIWSEVEKALDNLRAA
jgi:hypothetical protein